MNHFPHLTAMLALSFGCGCSTMDVQHTAATDTELSGHRTFGFATAAQPSDPRYFTVTNQARIRAAIEAELEARGYELADSPDFQIYFYVATTEKLYDLSKPKAEAGSMAYNLQKHYGFLYDRSLGSESVVNYTEGTLTVHVVDTRQNRMVWEGAARGVLYHNRTDDQIQARVREAVGTIFKKFPRR